jgi:hypothetical protein
MKLGVNMSAAQVFRASVSVGGCGDLGFAVNPCRRAQSKSVGRDGSRRWGEHASDLLRQDAF